MTDDILWDFEYAIRKEETIKSPKKNGGMRHHMNAATVRRGGRGSRGAVPCEASVILVKPRLSSPRLLSAPLLEPVAPLVPSPCVWKAMAEHSLFVLSQMS